MENRTLTSGGLLPLDELPLPASLLLFTWRVSPERKKNILEEVVQVQVQKYVGVGGRKFH